MKLSTGIQGAAAGVSAAALACLIAVPGSAQAATAGSGASAAITLQSASVAAGTQPELTFITSGAPAGAVVYLQEEGAGEPWHSIGRIRATAGTVRAPADQAGQYSYRIAVATSSGAAIVTSAPATLTVAGANGGAPASPAPSASTGGGCTACQVVKDALPWLALIVDPATVWDAITGVLTTIGGFLLGLLAL